MIKDPILKCPRCGTDDFLYAQPSKLFTYIECSKEAGGCGFQFTLPNDDSGTNKIRDNFLQQELEEPLDRIFAGYFGSRAVGETVLTWTLVGLVSELKKDELEKHLKEKVELYSKLKEVKEAKYVIKEYNSVGAGTFPIASVDETPNVTLTPTISGTEIKDITAARSLLVPQSEVKISEELLRDHGQVVKITCTSCGSKHLTYSPEGEEEIDITSSAMLNKFEEAKKSKEKFEWGIINCYGCEDQCNLLEIEFTDGTKINVSWEDYPRLYGVTNMKNYLDDVFGALAKAQKDGTKIIGI